MLALTIRGATEYLDEADQENAMGRYWTARNDGDASAKLVKIDRNPDDDPDPKPPTAPGQVSAVAQARIAIQDRSLKANGFSMAKPLFAAGTRVLPLGDQNFKLERIKVEQMPVWNDAANRVFDMINVENRQDIDVLLRDVRMTPSGELVVKGEPHAIGEDAFHQLVSLMGVGNGARYLASCPIDLRATNVNRQAELQRNRTLRLRTRQDGEGRAVFATVTPSYASVDTDRVLATVTPDLADSHVELIYDGTGARATGLFMPDQVVDLAAGDIFKVGVRIETDDTGRGRIRVSAVAFRNRCLNLIVIGEGTVETVSAVHKGDPARILDTVKDGVIAARAKVGDFLEAWGHARKRTIDVAATLRNWVDDKKLGNIAVRDRDEAVEQLLQSWRVEPGDTLADAVNAVTRSAHESPWWTRDLRAELEQRAANLVLVPA